MGSDLFLWASVVHSCSRRRFHLAILVIGQMFETHDWSVEDVFLDLKMRWVLRFIIAFSAIRPTQSDLFPISHFTVTGMTSTSTNKVGYPSYSTFYGYGNDLNVARMFRSVAIPRLNDWMKKRKRIIEWIHPSNPSVATKPPRRHAASWCYSACHYARHGDIHSLCSLSLLVELVLYS